MNTEQLAAEIVPVLSASPANGNGAATDHGQQKETKIQEPEIITMDEIQEQKVDWFWENRIPRGKVTLVDGDPGVGKSRLSLAIAAAKSKGDTLPGESKPTSTELTLLINLEDGPADTIKPNLRLAGADMSKIVIPNPKRGDEKNAAWIERQIKEIGPGLVILDPIIGFARHRNTDAAVQVRDLLQPLAGMAERYGPAMLIARHLNKSGNTKAIYRGQGSVDFQAICRSAFLIAEDAEEPGRRVMAHVKNSLGPKTPSLSFYIDADGFRWGPEVSATADELLDAEAQATKGRERVQLEAAKTFILEKLSAGPVPSKDIEDKAERAGISRPSLWRAKKELPQVKASKQIGGAWAWRLECHD